MLQTIKKIIPNTLTSCNLIAGCIATFHAFTGNVDIALLWIVIGAAFDFFDGMSARLLHVSSPIGKELDSLADDITFGFAPAAIVFTLLRALFPTTACSAGTCPVAGLIPYAAFLIAAFSALRLAKFNLDERQSTSFIGLPTPANALFWGSFILGWHDQLESSPWALPLLLVLILLSCYLLIAEIPMFALKFKHWGWAENQLKYIFILCCIPILLVCGVAGISLIIVWYILVSVYKNFTDKLKQQ